ncbi:MAG: hypothetical protein JSR45_14230 [Proteobacteria bacterium]|nr:hypothetical protein [Pseudomonadota bacterium]
MAAMRLELRLPAAWLRRHAPAVGGAVLVNAALLGAMVLLERETRATPDSPEIVVTLVDHRPRPHPPAPKQAGPREAPSPQPAASPPPRPVLRPAAPPPSGSPPPPEPIYQPEWTAPAPSTRDMDVRPSTWRSLRVRDACANGELDKMNTQEKARCIDRMAKYKPDPADGPAGFGKHEKLKDPHGDWARAAAAQEDRRKPMGAAPVHRCANTPMPNFDIPCHDQ